MTETATLTYMGKTYQLPVVEGTEGEKGIDISDLRARQFVREDFQRFDRIYAMDTNNLSDVLSLAPDASLAARAELFLHLSHPGSKRSVPDPKIL